MATPREDDLVTRAIGWLPLPSAVRWLLYLIWDTVQNYGRERGGETAAAIAYYSLFSIFPLLLFLVSGASYVLGSAARHEEIVHTVASYIPGSEDLLLTIVRQVLSARGPVTVIALVALLWSSSGVFSLLAAAIERPWPVRRPRPFWKQKLLGLGLAAMIGVLVIVAIAASSAAQLLHRYGDALLPQQLVEALSGVDIIGYTIAVVANSSAFTLLYKWTPTVRVPWRAALVGAVPAGVAWEAAKAIFAWYLSTYAVRNFSLVYGSLGAVVALLLWIYLSAVILLLGAALCAAYGVRVNDAANETAASG